VDLIVLVLEAITTIIPMVLAELKTSFEITFVIERRNQDTVVGRLGKN
jgi:hypothetical protein